MYPLALLLKSKQQKIKKCQKQNIKKNPKIKTYFMGTYSQLKG